jgi:hypothetical protein
MVFGTSGLTGHSAMLIAELEHSIGLGPVKVQKMEEETVKEKAVKTRIAMLQDCAQV